MKAVSGKEIVYNMMLLGNAIVRWNRQYTLKGRIVLRMEELGLTRHQMQLMGFIHANPDINTISALSEALIISKASLSLMLTKLTKAGYVRKDAATGEDDGRKVYISLTGQGEAALHEIMGLLVEHAAVAFDTMDEEKRTLFYEKIKELQEIFKTGGWKE